MSHENGAALQSRVTADWPSWPVEFVRGLSERGLSFQFSAVHDTSFDPIEPRQNHSSFARYSLDLSATVDGGRSFGWRGGQALVHLKQHINEFGRDYGEAAQGYSNIDGQSRTTLYEVWGQQALFIDKLRVKAGKFDANTEFAVVPSASDFLNSSMGYSPTIMDFPTYPEPKLGVDISIRIPKATQLSLGILNASENTRMSVIELAHGWSVATNKLDGRGSLGYWYLGGSIDRFDGDRASGTHGFFGVLEQTIWQGDTHRETDSAPRLSFFAQYGTGDHAENPFVYHFGAGTIMSGPFRSRPSDATGFAATWVRFTDEPLCGFDAKVERVVEAYYKFSLGHHTAFFSDLQFYQHPGGFRSHPDSLVATSRVSVSF